MLGLKVPGSNQGIRGIRRPRRCGLTYRESRLEQTREMGAEYGVYELHKVKPDELEHDSSSRSSAATNESCPRTDLPKCRGRPPPEGGEISHGKIHRRQARDEWRQHCRKQRSSGRQDEFVDFDSEKLQTVTQSIKSGTAAGYDNMLPEFLKHMGPRAVSWPKLTFMGIIPTTPRKFWTLVGPARERGVKGSMM